MAQRSRFNKINMWHDDGKFFARIICWFRGHVPHRIQMQSFFQDGSGYQYYLCRRCEAHGVEFI